MHRQQAVNVKIGDMLDPLGLWNASERVRKLTYPTEVLDVLHQRGCQTGVLLKVRFTNGAESYLDAGWFNAPNDKGNRAAEGGPVDPPVRRSSTQR